MPLVNEVVIGLPDKDRFNAGKPRDDAALLDYVTHPALPALIESLFPSARAPTNFPRTDLVTVFLKGLEGLNQPKNVTPSEMLRLNTAIAPVAAASQNPLGVAAGDNAGFPNGRRDAPAGGLPLTDGVRKTAANFGTAFPYLTTPLPGNLNPAPAAGTSFP
jgi:hypothetical protein